MNFGKMVAFTNGTRVFPAVVVKDLGEDVVNLRVLGNSSGGLELEEAVPPRSEAVEARFWETLEEHDANQVLTEDKGKGKGKGKAK